MTTGLAKIILATYNLVDVPTINIALRVVQRSVEEFTDILAKNPGLWVNVVNAKGKVLFQAKSVSSGDVKPYRDSGLTVETITTSSDNLPVESGDTKAKKFAELKRQMDARANPDVSHRDDVYTFTSKQVYPAQIIIPSYHVESSWHCEKCKKLAVCRKLVEDGMDYIVCEECAKKARLNWNKLEKL